MSVKVYIDGREGTTGLKIYERLGAREDIELLYIPDEYRKDPVARKEYSGRGGAGSGGYGRG